MLKRIALASVFFLFCSLSATSVFAEIIEYYLDIAQQDVNITGNPVPAMTINGTIPGPTLRFKEGDSARIHVHNKMDELPLPMNFPSAKAAPTGITPIPACKSRAVYTAQSLLNQNMTNSMWTVIT
jgi:FtsP/CotA-like multicopper oxidase with cupredoxin domain